jgi:hypothetical protein
VPGSRLRLARSLLGNVYASHRLRRTASGRGSKCRAKSRHCASTIVSVKEAAIYAALRDREKLRERAVADQLRVSKSAQALYDGLCGVPPETNT